MNGCAQSHRLIENQTYTCVLIKANPLATIYTIYQALQALLV